MSFERSFVVPSSLDEVFAWHARRGAIHRLMPPWQPVKVAEEADSLKSGQAVLVAPAGIRWTAAHQPGEYDPPLRFVDVLTTPVLREILGWRHEHDFADAGAGRTRVTDRVESRVPTFLLRQMFAYRARQLSGDLAAHGWADSLLRQDGAAAVPLTVAITGASGLIGSALSAFLTTGGHDVVRLVRHDPKSENERRWDPDNPARDLLDGVDAVVHLAGESIAGRFTEAHKRAIRNSRIGPTRRLAALVGTRTFISASAIGFYGADRGDEELDEESERGDGFLADVVSDWEADADPARESQARVVHVRTGIVQTPKGGSLRLLRPLFEAGLGGRLGSGQQWTSWIGVDDLLDVYLRALTDAGVAGPVNAVAPHPVRNIDYTKTLARVMRRPAIAPVPDFGPKLLLGREGAAEVAQAGQRVLPRKLDGLGHPFRHPELEPALRHLLGRVPV